MNKKIKFLFIAILLLFVNVLPTDLFGQGEANIWYFGNGAGLDFNFTPPSQLENGNANLGALNFEGVGSIADANGNLLFYTDGRVAYNKNHLAMPTGSGLLGGDGSSTQSGLCLPINGSTTQYFIVSTDNGTSRSYYSVVDMTLDGGLGDVTTKNSALVAANCSEAVVAIPEYDASNNPTGENWIIFHDHNSNSYRQYKTNGATISFVATYSVGFAVPSQKAVLLKTNGCFDKIAFAIYNSGRVEVLPFNNVTGVISSPNLILAGTGGNPFLNVEVFGIEFSPNEQFLYVSESGLNNRKTIYQFDISLGTGTNPAAVLASKSFYTGDGTVDRFGHLQLAPDGKIYCPGFNFSLPNYMSVVATPDVAWTIPTPSATQFEFKKYTYTVKRVGEGLPTFSQNLLRAIKIFYNNACEGGTTSFSYLFGGSAVSQSWDFGDPGSGGLNTSTSPTPSHIYTTAGTYTVTLTIVDNCGRTRTATANVIVKSGPTYTLPATLCPNTNIVITGTGTNKANYTWSTSATGLPVLATGDTYTYNGALPATVYVQDPTPLATYTTGNTTASQDFASDFGDTRFELFTTAKLASFQAIGKTASTATLTLYKWNGTAWVAASGSEAWSQAYTVANGVTYTYSPNVTLSAGKYRIFSSNDESFYKNNGSIDGGRDVNGVVNVYGDTDGGTKGGPYINIVFALPDPCGIRAIPIAANCCTPPTITTHPSSITRCAGVAASFTVATSAATPTYQWQVSTDNGGTWNNIVGETLATYSIAAGSVTTALNNYQYRAVVTGASCFANSNAAILTVNAVPGITNTPLTAAICESASWAGVTLTADVVGTTFAWSSTATAGITGNTAGGTGNLPSQTFAHSGVVAGTVTYSITPTANSCPGSPSDYVVTVNPIPVITNTPLTVPVCENTLWGGLTITSDVAGTTFAWTSVASAGITGNTASGTGNLPSQTFANSGTTSGTVTYTITPTANSCPGTPVDYVVTVNPLAVVTNTPLTASVCEGTSWAGLTITADVAGTTFAWTSSASAGITGNTASGTGNLPSQTFANSGSTAGTVTYVITPTANSCPGASVNYVVTVNPAPVVTNTPLTASVCEGSLWAGLTITSDVAGTTFAWTSSVSAGITGNTASGTGNLPSQTFANSLTTPETVTYSITPTAATCSGTVSNYVVTVNPIPAVTNTPLTGSTCSGSAWAGLTLTADVTGTTYAWTSTASAGITGNTASGTGNLPSQTLTNSGTSAGTVTYTITPTANTCPGTPVNYVVTVNPATIISVHPTATTNLCVGAALNLSVTATGTALSYQWNLNGAPIGGAISSTYSIPTVALADAGTYTVTVTGTCGVVTSNNAVVNINGVVINTQPANQGPCVGGSATFTVVSSGPVLTYQWQENTGSGFSNIGGATSASYNIPVVGAGMNGYTYQVIIQSNGLCPVTSTIATLTVNTNTTINTHPASAGLCVGNAMTLSVNASGSGIITYQWRKGGVIIGGATSDTYTIASVTSADAGSYTVDVSSDCGPATSNAAVITINNVSITADPANQTICEGDNHTFSVTATGLGTLTYQWQTDSGTGTFANIGGQTSSSLAITGASLTLNGYQYRVVIRDDNLCPATSAAATLTVNPLTVITTSPSAATLCVGNALNLSVTATGSGVLGYQWNLGGAPIGGATSSTYAIASVTGANAGSYTVDITGGCSNVSSTAVLVTVNGVTISADPTSQTICEGNDHTFTVTATGLGTLTYQWQTDNGTGTFVNILGATSSSYTIVAPAQTISGYQYRVIIRDDNLCPGISAAATLTVNPATSITNSPVGGNLCLGDALNLSVTATGTGLLSYQWNLNGTPIGGAISSTYSVGSVTAADAGSYTVDVTGNCTVTSSSATVAVNGVSISADPSNQTICEGSNHTFTVTATGLGTLTYQWQTDNGTGIFSNIAGQTSSSLTLTGASLTMNGYQYRVILRDDNVCPATSAAATLTVNPLTDITSDPVGANLCIGNSLNLSVFAAGTGVLGYQWNLGGAPIGGATSSTYTVLSVTGANAGSYTVTVTGGCGASVTSIAAIVAVNGVTITADPVTTTVCEGTNASFSVTASGLGTLTYQWQTDNGTGVFVNIAGETSATLTLTAVSQTLNNYQYQVIIRDDNTCPSTSAIGMLIVNPATVINIHPAGAVVCEGDPLNLSVTATGNNPLTYQWQYNSVDIGGATSSSYSVAVTTPANTGAYTVVVTSGSALCADVTSNSANVVVTAAPLDNLTVTTADVCEGTDATVTIAGSESGMSYEAFIGATLVSSGTGNGGNLILTVNSSSLSVGSNTITINAVGCRTVTLLNSATLVVLASPGTISGSNQVCSNAINGLSYSIGAVTGASTYTWAIDNGGAINSGQGTNAVNVNLGTAPTTLTVTPETASGLTCQTATLAVNQITAYVGLDNLSLNEDTVCAGNSITVTINNPSAESYVWTMPAGASIGSQTATSATINFSNAGNLTVSVQPVHQCNPVIAPLTINVVILQPPSANAGSDIHLTTIQSVTLNGSGSSTGPVYGYSWTSNDPGAVISTPNAISTIVQPKLLIGDYTLTVYTINDAGCQASDDVKITIDFKVKVPNVFSPNGDGNHDVLQVQNIEYFPNSIMYVYNQWGELVFKSAPGYTTPWDGTRNGQAVPVSAYYYILELNETNYKSLSGDVTIIR